MTDEEPLKDYSAEHNCFGRYCEPNTPWVPDGELYILCCHCTHMFECQAAKNKDQPHES